MTEMDPGVDRRTLLRGTMGVTLWGAGALTMAGCVGQDQPSATGDVSTGPFGVSAPQTIAYGPNEKTQYGQLAVPLQEDGNPVTKPVPVVVMIHGGGWDDASEMSYMIDIATDLVSYGVAVWTIAYRGTIHPGQTDRGPARPAWPAAGYDVASAVDFVPRLAEHSPVPLDPSRTIALGHSAGGHLATWAASRHKLEKGVVGAAPKVKPVGCVSMAGVYDMRQAYERDPDGAIRDVMGGTPTEEPTAYKEASPQALLPTGIPVVVCRGGQDEVVPAEQSENYVTAAKKRGDPVDTAVVADADHNAWTVPDHPAWASAREHVLTLARV